MHSFEDLHHNTFAMLSFFFLASGLLQSSRPMASSTFFHLEGALIVDWFEYLIRYNIIFKQSCVRCQKIIFHHYTDPVRIWDDLLHGKQKLEIQSLILLTGMPEKHSLQKIVYTQVESVPILLREKGI